MPKRISIITPSLNQGEFLEQSIQSVLSQNYPDLEYIVIDGGSTDNSIDIIKKYENRLTYWVSEADRGQAHAINKGFHRASGQIYGWLNADDFLLPGCLATMAELHRQRPDAVVWAGATHNVDRQENWLNTSSPVPGDKASLGIWSPRRGAFLHQPGCFFDAAAFHAIGGLNENLTYALDVDLWMRLADRGCLACIDTPVAANRVHRDTKTLRDPLARETEHISMVYNHGEKNSARERLRSALTSSIALREMVAGSDGRPRLGKLVRSILRLGKFYLHTIMEDRHSSSKGGGKQIDKH